MLFVIKKRRHNHDFSAYFLVYKRRHYRDNLDMFSVIKRASVSRFFWCDFWCAKGVTVAKFWICFLCFLVLNINSGVQRASLPRIFRYVSVIKGLVCKGRHDREILDIISGVYFL